MSLLENPWKYINEGNAHIVIQILNTNYVYRLIKEDWMPTDVERVESSVNFVNLVMIPLLGNSTDEIQELIHIPPDQLSKLTNDLFKLRPENRLFKCNIGPLAIKAPNLTILSPQCKANYCIEIKPKEGFIARNLKGSGKCYYCLKQYLKLHDRGIDNISSYCPIDLFSGDKVIMKHALFGLVNNPQNNFKIFKDGRIIFDEKSSFTNFCDIIGAIKVFGESKDLLIDFIIEILLNKNQDNIILVENKDDIANKEKSEQCQEHDCLDKDSFLYKLLAIQKLTDTVKYDVIGDTGIEYVSSILENVKREALDLRISNHRVKFMTMSDPVHLALISAIVRDCSLMISFSSEYVTNFQTIQIGANKVPYKLAVTDLEPKAASTLNKRMKMEKKLLDIYKKQIFL